MSASYEHGYNEAWKEGREDIKAAREEGKAEGRREERAEVVEHIGKALKQWGEAMRTFQDEVQWRLLLSVLAEIERGEHVKRISRSHEKV